jgi:hypothetical protein
VFGFLGDSVVALRPTVGLAVSALAGDASTGLAAFLPTAKLMKLGLVVTEGDAPLAGRAIRVAPDLWPRLVGLHTSAARITSHQASSMSGTTVLAIGAAVRAIRAGERPLVIVTGERASSVVRELTSQLDGVAVLVDRACGADPELRRAAVRDAMWEGVPLVLESTITTDVLVELVGHAAPPVILPLEGGALAPVLTASERPIIEIPTEPFDQDARLETWRRLGADQLDVDLDALVSRFRFAPDRIASVMALARARSASRGESVNRDDVLHACRYLGGATTTTLANKLETTFVATDLIVPFATRAELAMFETAARHGHSLFGPSTRGGDIRGANGFIALFTGRPGTGKTMAAQIVARSLEIDVLRIDLSQVVDKYIGETEKRLDIVFREAEASGALLFFDEADALFGKRTEVKDAHDRYSNIETAFLLQRLEQHPGVAILATNLANNLDTAFMRRIHFVIEFPLPGPAERTAIWDRHVQKAALADDVDLAFLSRFELSGGDIRNAAVAAVLLAHDEQRIAMRHLVLATSRELRKAGRLTQPDDFGPWREDVLAHLRGASEARLSS